jgi:hypothetical protein
MKIIWLLKASMFAEPYRDAEANLPLQQEVELV